MQAYLIASGLHYIHTKIHKYMKYLKTKFIITDGNAHNIEEETLMQAARDILCDIAGSAGFESFEEEQHGVTGYVQKQLFSKEALDECIRLFPIENINISYDIQDAEDKNWNKPWEEQGFEPIDIDGKCIIHDTLHPTESKDRNKILDITIDAEQAFGTGNHETTYMIIKELLDCDIKDKDVLDCGCGTGILSITAAKLGAKSITGYDIDEWSVRNTIRNCNLNDVSNIEVLLGNADILNGITEMYDIVLANINRNILLSDMTAFKLKMTDNAILILSGFYKQDSVILTRKAKSLGLSLIKAENKNDWCMLKFKRTE